MTEVIQTRIDGGVFEVTLDRPKANAIDLATVSYTHLTLPTKRIV